MKTNYRHRRGLYTCSWQNFGKAVRLVPPWEHVYELCDLTVGPLGEMSVTVRCSWLAARRFPYPLISMRTR